MAIITYGAKIAMINTRGGNKRRPIYAIRNKPRKNISFFAE
jgi:hypothetical protein